MTQPGEQQQSQAGISLPAAKLTVREEEALPIYRRDWERIRRCVQAISQPQRHALNLAWSMVGVAGAAVLAWVPWQAARSQLPAAAQLKYAWVTPALLAAVAAAIVIALLGFVFARGQSEQTRIDVADVLADMDSIHPPIETPGVRGDST